MSEPQYTQFTERMYARLPEVMREADALNGYVLKHYISAIGDVQDQVERLIARFMYLSKQDRLGLDQLADDHGYYDLDWRYFQSTDSKNSAMISSSASAFLRTQDAYRVVPNTIVYAGAVFRTDSTDPANAHGLRLWYYDAAMEPLTFRDVATGNGGRGPQWWALNATDEVPSEAYYIRVSPWSKPTSGTVRVWVDDVYVRSHHEVSTTNNLVSGGHNFVTRAERDLVLQGDFDATYEVGPGLEEWDRGPSTELVEKDLSGVPDVQSYRTWLNLASTNADQPGYARQVLQGLAPDATYDVSLLMVREADTPDDATLRITITPDTGGPTAKTFTLTDYDTETPHLLTYTWNSPETVSTAIINVEYIAPTPSSGLLINDISVVRYLADVSQIGREGTSVTSRVLERAGETILGSGSVTSSAWARVDPSTLEELETGDQGPATGVSYMHRAWHPTRPGNRYSLTGEFFTDHSGAYVDLTILYRIEGKGWGEQMLHRVSATPVSTWVQFTRAITIPPTATEFRVIVSPYRSGSTRRTEVRNLALASPTDRSWYAAGSRPFAFAALTSRSMNFLSRGDLLHYSANLMVTGDPSYGRYGIRIYAGGGQVVHETVVMPRTGDGLVKVVGAFQVPESLIDLRAVLYVDDPTPKHQAAYFLSELDIVHSSQRFVEDPQNLIRNGGFEFTNALEGWNLLTERETVRKNLVPNPVGPSAISASDWRTTSGDSLTLVQDEGRPALKLIEGGTNTGLYMDPDKNYTDIPVGSKIRFSADVKVTADIDQMRLTISAYNGAVRTGGSTGWLTQTPADGWVRHTVEAVVTDAPEGSHFRMLVWPANDSYPAGQGFLVRDVMIEIDTTGKFFDRYTPDTALSTYSWDGEAHVARTLAHEPPATLPMSVSTDTGYNREDVPDRPDDVPLGSTSDLVDPRTANTEWLPWLSQFAGHNINHFSSLEEARNAFASTESNFAAGTIGAIQNAVGAVLTGTRTVRVFPMTTRLDQVGQASQWDIAIVTRTSESPDISVMEEAVSLRNAKPVGVVFHFFKHQSTWDAVELANPDWNTWDTRNWTQIEEAGLAEG